MDFKQIDVIFPAYINAPIGPTGTLRRLIANKEYLRSRGYELNVFTADFLKGQNVSAPVDFSAGLNTRSKQKELIKKSRVLSSLFQWRAARNAKRLVKKYLEQNRTPSVLVFHEQSCCYYYLRLARNNTKTVLFHHSNGVFGEMLLKSYPKLNGSFFLKDSYRRYKYVINKVNSNVFISYEGRNNFIKANPNIDARNIYVFHNGIDNKEIIKGDLIYGCKYNLCTTGTVSARKGQYIIIEALNKIDIEKRKNIHVSILGNGQDRQMLEEKALSYGLAENVHFYGFVPNSEIHEKLCKHNIYILMSNNEGLPISIIEAMRAGLGIISTRVSGIPEEVDDRNGILIDPDIEQLSEVLNHLDDYDWNLLGQASRKRFENEFTFEQMMNAYCNMVDKTIVE